MIFSSKQNIIDDNSGTRSEKQLYIYTFSTYNDIASLLTSYSSGVSVSFFLRVLIAVSVGVFWWILNENLILNLNEMTYKYKLIDSVENFWHQIWNKFYYIFLPSMSNIYFKLFFRIGLRYFCYCFWWVPLVYYFTLHDYCRFGLKCSFVICYFLLIMAFLV